MFFRGSSVRPIHDQLQLSKRHKNLSGIRPYYALQSVQTIRESCTESEFACCSVPQRCLPLSMRCNGHTDCADGDDENNCPSCARYEFACVKSGRCILAEKRCDGIVDDCGDGSNLDEIGCGRNTKFNHVLCVRDVELGQQFVPPEPPKPKIVITKEDKRNKTLWRHIIWLIVLFAYSLLGGLIFSAIEGGNDRSYLVVEYEKNMDIFKRRRFYQEQLFRRYERKLGVVVEEPMMMESKWTLWGGVYYAASLYTTIGYGNFFPRTTSGRIMSMLYAFFGIPLVFTILCEWGFLYFTWIEYGWNWVNEKFCQKSLQRQVEKRYLRERIRRVGSELSLHSMSTVPLLSVHRTTSNMVNTTDHQAKVRLVFDRLIRSIDSQYRIRQIDPDVATMTLIPDEKEGIKRLIGAQPLQDRIVFIFMDEHKKCMLRERWKLRSGMVNRITQTYPSRADKYVQTGNRVYDQPGQIGGAEDEDEEDWDEEEEGDEDEEDVEYDEAGNRIVPPSTKRYIYTVFD
ncbi:Low-density lipoprotein receptor domain class A [Teladorsagia circumcincta]|uniref:Low-density lipoprotein receptor domain class A n=1 Tax=Teladorsagia circumcincta TaxID=45464 RepID=A0A2G9UQW7_TELCI|nr:Low-density lipoprotein receptor domain class A [Teladorsagia circumcincta]